MNNISEGIINSLSDITDLKVQTQEAVEARLSNLTNGIDNIVDKLNSSIEPVSKASQSLNEIGESVTDSISEISNKTSDLSSVIGESIKSFDGIENFSKDLSVLLNTINEFNVSMEKATTVNNEASNKISESASTTESATGQLANDIAEVYKQLTIQIRALRSS